MIMEPARMTHLAMIFNQDNRSDGQPILPASHLKKVNNHIFIV